MPSLSSPECGLAPPVLPWACGNPLVMKKRRIRGLRLGLLAKRANLGLMTQIRAVAVGAVVRTRRAACILSASWGPMVVGCGFGGIWGLAH